jgi:type IV pilus assembly protein PilM
MGLLPKTMGTRPRLACEIRAEGVAAARAEDSSGSLTSTQRVTLVNGLAANATARAERLSAVKQALDAVSQRGREVTLIVPDSAARVLLIDFDELPAKAAEALPVVRFRLKKLLPFDADDAAVSYQVMAQTRSMTQVLAVAMPREILADYESLVRDAGYEPGAVLPSTLAALAGLEEDAAPSLVVNTGRDSVTTAIVKDGVLLLHRTIFLAAGDLAAAGTAATQIVPNPTAQPVATLAAATAPNPPTPREDIAREASRDTSIAAIAARFAAMEGQTTPAPRAPEPPAISRVGSALATGMPVTSLTANTSPAPNTPSPQTTAAPAEEIAQAVSVAAAYFEDTLGFAPHAVLSAGPLGAEALTKLLGASAPHVQEIVSSGANRQVPAGWLAGIQGALRS